MCRSHDSKAGEMGNMVEYVNKFGYELNIFQVKGVISYLYK